MDSDDVFRKFEDALTEWTLTGQKRMLLADCKQRHLETQNVSFIIPFRKKHLTTNSYLAQRGVDHRTCSNRMKKANSTGKHINLKTLFSRYCPAAKASTGKVFVMPARLLKRILPVGGSSTEMSPTGGHSIISLAFTPLSFLILFFSTCPDPHVPGGLHEPDFDHISQREKPCWEFIFFKKGKGHFQPFLMALLDNCSFLFCHG